MDVMISKNEVALQLYRLIVAGTAKFDKAELDVPSKKSKRRLTMTNVSITGANYATDRESDYVIYTLHLDFEKLTHSLV